MGNLLSCVKKTNSKESSTRPILSASPSTILNRLSSSQVYLLKEKLQLKKEITFKDFKSLLPSDTSVPERLCYAAFRLFDPHKKGSITHRELFMALSLYILGSSYEKTHFIFFLFDTKRHGVLNSKQITQLNSFTSDFLRGTPLPEKVSLQLEDFQYWALENLDLDQIMRPFELIPSPFTEKLIIKNSFGKEFKEGDKWNFVNQDWMKAWKMYVNYDDGQVCNYRPCEIDNCHLGTSIIQSYTLQEYDLVPSEVWNHLHKWYGGGPEIQTQVISQNGELRIDLNLFPVQILYKEKVSQHFLSSKATVEDILLSLNCPENYQIRHMTEILNLSQTIEELKLKANPLLELVEECTLETNFLDTASPSPNLLVSNKKIGKRKGISNIGNTCYLSAVIQCLAQTPMLPIFFRKNYAEFLDNSKIATEFAEVMTQIMYNTGVCRPHKLYSKFCRLVPSFEGHIQQDSHEFLRILLDLLHEDLNKNTKTKVSKTVSIDNPDREKEIKISEDHWHASQGSVISDYFGGQTRRELTCQDCSHRVVIFETFMDLSLPIPIKNGKKLKIHLVKPKTVQIVVFALTRSSTLKEISNKIKELTQGQPFFFAHVQKSSIERVIEKPQELTDIIPDVSQKLYAYEDQNEAFFEENSSYRLLPIIMRKKNQSVFGTPQLLRVNNANTLKNVHEQITAVLENKKHFKIMLMDKFSGLCVLCNNPFCEGCPFNNDTTILERVRECSIGIIWHKSQYYLRPTVTKTIVKGKIDVFDCLEEFYKEEILDKQCEKCNCHKMRSQIGIWRLPDILILNLKRFYFKDRMMKKIYRHVSFPLKDFNFNTSDSPKFPSTSQKESLYNLYATVSHFGNSNAGHYKAYGLKEESWVEYDDEHVYPVYATEEIVSPNSYLLFYQRQRFATSNMINLL